MGWYRVTKRTLKKKSIRIRTQSSLIWRMTTPTAGILWNLQDFARRQNWRFSLQVQDIMTSLIAGQESRMFRHYSLKKHTNWYFQTF